ncbi:OmpA family protein [bacterium]|nr:OmpA family protein [bacterium]
MQVRKTTSIMIGAAALALLMAPGCTSNKKFNEHVEVVDARLDALDSGVEDNESRINDLKTDTDGKIGRAQSTADSAKSTADQAMTRANQANSAATQAQNGKLLWTVKITDDRTKFDLGQAGLSDASKKSLDDLIRKIKSHNKGVYLEIAGHTDSSGSEGFNQKLGAKRAEMVRDYMYQNGGIPLHAMTTISYGETMPEADNSTREGRAANRRVVVRVLE